MNRSLRRSFWTQVTPLPLPSASFAQKTIVVTGANRSLGLEAARHFVRLNASKVILGCRSLSRGEDAKRDIERSQGVTGIVEAWEVDLGSFDSVRRFCQRVAELPRLDAVIENAGMATSEFGLYEGYERQVTVNVISTYLMALLLLPTLRRTYDRFYNTAHVAPDDRPHLVIVSSNAHFYAPCQHQQSSSVFGPFQHIESSMYLRYQDTKLISLLVGRAISENMQRPDGNIPVVLNMVCPGYCKTDLGREKPWPPLWTAIFTVTDRILARTAEMGSRTLVMAASAGLVSHGMYLEDCKLSTPSDFVRSGNGEKMQQQAFTELMLILEGIEPSVQFGPPGG
ncbi:short-chain dehydrogenase/reductase-like protein [Nemania abortiva]|nr:short-chain dehydrogenase/reductase-like protein [Nemania abortiva]